MRQMTLQELQDILHECAGVADESAPSFEQEPDQSFNDLGYDSIALLEMQGRVRQEYGIELSEDDITNVATPREYVEAFNSLLLAA